MTRFVARIVARIVGSTGTDFTVLPLQCRSSSGSTTGPSSAGPTTVEVLPALGIGGDSPLPVVSYIEPHMAS